MSRSEYFVGLISGTSVDGVDAVVTRIDDNGVQLLSSHCEAYPEALRQEIRKLAQPGANEIDRLGSVDRQIADCFSQAAITVIAGAGLSGADITAIGSHGQTVRHRPDGAFPFTLQIGDPNRIAEQTGIITVADFRRRDMAAGGQGAPLVPAFHRALFSLPGETSAVVNIGGIANVTVLKADGHLTGFDTGPGNTLMDHWIHRHHKKPYDADGNWAASGVLDTTLLDKLMADPYFRLPAPKSTGPEYFSPDWLAARLGSDTDAASVQRTLLEFTARTIADTLVGSELRQVAICGGGAHNRLLMTRLEELLSAPVVTTEAMGIDPDWVEAAAFAWLAHRALAGLPGNEPDATGARDYRVLGAIYPGR